MARGAVAVLISVSEGNGKPVANPDPAAARHRSADVGQSRISAEEIDLRDQRLPASPSAMGKSLSTVCQREPTVVIVGIADESEMFALGIRTCLAESRTIRVAASIDDDVDVAVVSAGMAEQRSFCCPLVVCGDPPDRVAPANSVLAVLSRPTLTSKQLVATVHAAVAGLRIMHVDEARIPKLSDRAVAVLSLLAAGADTSEIAARLGYSDRTIKGVIHDVGLSLGTRNRSQAVAEAIRKV